MKRFVYLAGLICFLFSTLGHAENPDVDKKLGNIIRELEAKLQAIETDNKAVDDRNAARKKAFLDMKDALIDLDVTGKKEIFAGDAKRIREALVKLAGVKKHLYLPDYEPEIDAILKLDLKHFPQTKNELTKLKEEITTLKKNKVPRTDAMIRRDAAPVPAPKEDPARFQSLKEITEKAKKSNLACPSCEAIAADMKKIEKEKYALIDKREALYKENRKTTGAGLGRELELDLLRLKNKLRAQVTKMFTVVFKDGAKEYDGKKIYVDEQSPTVGSLSNYLSILMAESLLQKKDPFFPKGIKDAYGVDGITSYEDLFDKVKEKGADSSLFTKLHGFITDPERPSSWKFKGGDDQPIKTEIKLKDTATKDDFKELDNLYKAYQTLVQDRKYKDVVVAVTGENLIKIKRDIELLDYKIEKFDRCGQCRKRSDEAILKSREGLDSGLLRTKIHDAHDNYSHGADYVIPNRPKAKK